MSEGALGEELEAIRAIARTRRTHDVESLCEELQAIAARSTQSERCAIYLLDPSKSELILPTTPFGYEGSLAKLLRRNPLDTPILGDVVRTLRPCLFNVTSIPEPHRAASIQDGFVEYAVIPLHSDEALTGTLNLARTRAEPYSAKTVRLATAMADQISVQIERARMHVELVRKERLASLGELAALVAHEVRNPLGVLFNVASQLRRVVGSESREATQLMGILEEEAGRLDRIVHDFLDFGRPASPQFGVVDLGAVMDTAIELATLGLPNAQIEWHIELDADARRLIADAHLLRQALVNLLTNALEAQSGRGAVWVRTDRYEDEGREFVRLSIENDGATVDANIVQKVFEPFFTTKTSGTGLGLTIVRRTVEAHSGQVTIRPREGGGTVLTMTLPLGPLGARETTRREETEA